MNWRRGAGARFAAATLFTAGLPAAAHSLTLDEAIARAEKSNPTLVQSNAQAAAAKARVAQAEAGRLPSVDLTGQVGLGDMNLGGFFGLGNSVVHPRGAAIQLTQPVFAGGAINAAIDRARQGRDAALAEAAGAKGLLAAQVAEAYVTVLGARHLLALENAHLAALEEIARGADLKFKDGESPRTERDQAKARLAGAEADLARTTGDLVRARAHFVALVGIEPDDLAPPGAPPVAAASLDAAVDLAVQSSPTLLAAEAQARAARAGVRFARADRLPKVALTASASTIRDQFFPGYRNDGYTVGVQGQWSLFSGGLVSGKISEAQADLSAAEAGLDAARAQVRDAVVGAWQDVITARAVAAAAADQSAAAASALDSVRNEVRVGQKPTADLLDAEREDLDAQSALVIAEGQTIADAYRLDALLHGR